MFDNKQHQTNLELEHEYKMKQIEYEHQCKMHFIEELRKLESLKHSYNMEIQRIRTAEMRKAQQWKKENYKTFKKSE